MSSELDDMVEVALRAASEGKPGGVSTTAVFNELRETGRPMPRQRVSGALRRLVFLDRAQEPRPGYFATEEV